MASGSLWRRLHQRLPPIVRWPLKAAFVALVVLLALYPRLDLLAANLRHWSDLNALIDPHDPRLAALEREVEARAAESDPDAKLHAHVERVVYRAIPYAFDWETWGVMDYLPTLSQVLDQGREDCDGRAVVAASLLRRMGCDAGLATDLKHVWVVTPTGELMGPGAGAKTMIADETGTRVVLSADTLANLGRGLAFGIAVFPLQRELLIVLALWLALLHPWSNAWRRWVGGGLLLAALLLLRAAGASTDALAHSPALLWGGVGVALVGVLVVALRRRGARESRPGAPCAEGGRSTCGPSSPRTQLP